MKSKEELQQQFDLEDLIINDFISKDLSFTTSSKGERLDQGTNTTIFIYDDYIDPSQKDPNRENNQSCQAPIKPFVKRVSGIGPNSYGIGAASIEGSFVI